MSRQLLVSLLNCSWQWGLLGGIIWFLIRRLRLSNTTAYLLWLFSLISLPILFGLNQFVPAFSIGGAVPELTREQPINVPSLSSAVRDLPETLSTDSETQSKNQLLAKVRFFANWTKMDMILCLWAFGSLTMLIRFAFGLYQVHQLRGAATVADDSYQSICQRLAQDLNIGRQVRVCFSDRVVSPISFGLLTPCILIPRGLNLEQFKLVAVHELAHVRRLDWLTNLFSHLVGVFFFFHPLYHFLNRRLIDLREQICDDWVIQLTSARKNYAQCLLDLVHCKNMFIPLGLTLNQPSRLESRIDSILKNNRRLDLQPKRRLLLMAATLFLTCLPLLAMAQLVPLGTFQVSLFTQTPQKPKKGIDETERGNSKQKESDQIEKTYSVKLGGSLKVISEFGALDVQTADQDKVEIVISKESEFKLDKWIQAALTDFEVTFEHKGSDVHINGIFKHGLEYWQKKRLKGLKIHFQVKVPQQYNVDLKTVGGRISVADLGGEVRAQTTGGSLRFGNIKGTVWGHTSGGSIKLTSCDSSNSVLKALGLTLPPRDNLIDLKTSGGNVEVHDVTGTVKVQTSGGSLRLGEIRGFIRGNTSGGSIELEECNGGAEVQTSGGSITLENVTGAVSVRTSGGSIDATMTMQPQHDSILNLRTSGGGIVVTLIPDIAVDLDARASGGHVSSDFPIVSMIKEKVLKSRLKGSINGGGPLLNLKTSGGNIRLKMGRK